jgi:hypothetical protein
MQVLSATDEDLRDLTRIKTEQPVSAVIFQGLKLFRLLSGIEKIQYEADADSP